LVQHIVWRYSRGVAQTDVFIHVNEFNCIWKDFHFGWRGCYYKSSSCDYQKVSFSMHKQRLYCGTQSCCLAKYKNHISNALVCADYEI